MHSIQRHLARAKPATKKCAAAADRFVETIGHRIFLRTICPERYFQMHSSLFARFSLIKLQIDYSSLNSICSIADDLEEHGGASLIEAEITDSGYSHARDFQPHRGTQQQYLLQLLSKDFQHFIASTHCVIVHLLDMSQQKVAVAEVGGVVTDIRILIR